MTINIIACCSVVTQHTAVLVNRSIGQVSLVLAEFLFLSFCSLFHEHGRAPRLEAYHHHIFLVFASTKSLDMIFIYCWCLKPSFHRHFSARWEAAKIVTVCRECVNTRSMNGRSAGATWQCYYVIVISWYKSVIP